MYGANTVTDSLGAGCARAGKLTPIESTATEHSFQCLCMCDPSSDCSDILEQEARVYLISLNSGGHAQGAARNLFHNDQQPRFTSSRCARRNSGGDDTADPHRVTARPPFGQGNTGLARQWRWGYCCPKARKLRANCAANSSPCHQRSGGNCAISPEMSTV